MIRFIEDRIVLSQPASRIQNPVCEVTRTQTIPTKTKMPLNLFGTSFSPGKSPPRRSVSLSSLRRETDKTGQDLSQEFNKIKLNIGGQNATFEDGEWVSEGSSKGRVSNREVARLRQQNQVLLEENNLLKLKVELLLDMLTEKSADTLIKEKEINRLKSRSKDG